MTRPKQRILFIIFPLFLPSLVGAQMSLIDAGVGIDRTVTVESKGQFRLVFEKKSVTCLMVMKLWVFHRRHALRI
jgi:hypothetical protein